MSPRAVAAVILISMALWRPCGAMGADEVQHINRAELKRLIATADTPADYQKLATYFHEREDVYRAKAQAEMRESAECVRNFVMTPPKIPTRADQTARLYEYYSAKADQQAKLAGHYDELLVRSGVKPLGKRYTVSATTITR